MQVGELMSQASVTDSPSDPLTAAAARMWRQQTGSLLVMDGDQLVGIVTERDVMKAVARRLDLASTPVSAVMTTQVLTVSPDTSVAEAAQHMADRWIRHLPVVRDGAVVGMVSQRDLCGVLARVDSSLYAAPSRGPLVRDRRLDRVDPPLSRDAAADETDEQAVGWGDRISAEERRSADERLLADRPPHWDGG